MKRLSARLRNLRIRVFAIQVFALLVMLPVGMGLVAVPYRGGGEYLFAIDPLLPVALGGVLCGCGAFLVLIGGGLPKYAQVLFMTPYMVFVMVSIAPVLSLAEPPFLLSERLALYWLTVLAIVRRPDEPDA